MHNMHVCTCDFDVHNFVHFFYMCIKKKFMCIVCTFDFFQILYTVGELLRCWFSTLLEYIAFDTCR